MVAAEVAAADNRHPREREARVKAAAWAWYQRSGGGVAAGAGRYEAFATRCTTRLSSSRFQREATIRARTLASQASDSTLTTSSSIDIFSGSSSSFSHCTAVFGDAVDRDVEIACNDTFDLHLDQDSYKQPSLDLVRIDPAICWDCGSSLFDSFELVAMSKKLDVELHEANIVGQHDLQTASVIGLGFDYNQQKVLSLCDTPHNALSPTSSPPHPHQDSCNAYNIFDKLVSAPDKQSKQAVYDMFCQYGDAAKLVTKQAGKRSNSAVIDASACGGETRKHKLRPGRMSFHGFAKALQSITHPLSQSNGSSGGGPDGIDSVQDHHHHHHLHYSPHSKASTGKVVYAKGQGARIGGAMPSGEQHVYDDVIEGSQNKSRHIHHHHHHHYHYLFHSDDEFRLQPAGLDKSLMVAAAGLRSLKANPTLSSYLESPARGDIPAVDFGRKWAEFGNIQPSPNFQY